MSEEPVAPPGATPDFESEPLTRAEYISALVHLYRGQLGRADAWRQRLDTTSNWAVVTTMGLLSFAFSSRDHSHASIVVGMILISHFLLVEARRYRVFDVWNSRVRMIEENFYGPILRRDPVSPRSEWGALVAEDLFHPRLKLTRLAALRQRLQRNYWAIYFVLLLAWCLKVLAHPFPAHTWKDVRERLELGFVPYWVPLLYVGGFLAAVVLLITVTPNQKGEDWEYWHQDERGSRAAELDL